MKPTSSAVSMGRVSAVTAPLRKRRASLQASAGRGKSGGACATGGAHRLQLSTCRRTDPMV